MNDPQRSKAAAMFGKAFMDAAKPTPPAKNYATAQQKVANSRPIPTYKTGGVVKKAMGGEAKAFNDAVASMPSPVMRAVGGAGKTRKGQAPIRKKDGGPVGAYTNKRGDVIRTRDLPEDVQEQVRELGAYRDTAKRAGRINQSARGVQAGLQKRINELYDPETRESRMQFEADRKAGAAKKPIKRAQGGPVKDGSKKDAEYGDYVAGEKDRKPVKPVKKAMGGVGKLRHNVPMKGVKPHKGIGV